MKKKFLRAFTLIELLVVITIIGILASLAIPTISAALEAAKKTEAKVFMSSLATAVVNYQTEYNVYPPFMTQAPFVTTNAVLTTESHWTDYYSALAVPANQTNTAAVTNNNPRLISFLTVQAKYLYAAGATKPTSDPTTASHFRDPWGQLYAMWVDTDYNNVLGDVYDLQLGGNNKKNLPGSVLVWSAASKSGTNSTKSIGTWK